VNGKEVFPQTFVGMELKPRGETIGTKFFEKNITTKLESERAKPGFNW
jgi:hypothetical protein